MALWFYAFTLFSSAFLLFLVQPMIGKMILPRLGGTPQVWNTCMVFFQTVLLAGYAYTHTVSSRLDLRKQLLVHGLILLLPILVLFGAAALSGDHNPFSILGWVPPPGSNPIPSTLTLLAIVVGIPFFVVATSAPLLQKWFAGTGHPAAKDPYFLYGASNLGSMLALLCYPVLVEPLLLLNTQSWTWTVGYAILVLFILGCAAMAWNTPPQLRLAGAEGEPPPGEIPVPPPVETSTAVSAAPPKEAARSTHRKKGGKQLHLKTPLAPAHAVAPRPDVMTWGRRLRWVGLAAVPSSLMLGVTTYICTDLSPIPLLWVVPLALYLLSFILVFMRWPVAWLGWPHTVVTFLHPVLILALALILIRGGFSLSFPTFKDPLSFLTFLMCAPMVALFAFFATALVCHGELAQDRPSTQHLTEYYLWMSVGGMVGGMFNGLFAPVLFTGVVEFPLAIVLGCLLRPRQVGDGWTESLFYTVAPEAKPWLVERGDDLARSFNQPAPRSGFLLSYSLDIFLPLLLGLITYWVTSRANDTDGWGWTMRSPQQNPLLRTMKTLGIPLGWYSGVFNALTYGVPMLICFLYLCRPIRLGLGIAALLLVNVGYQSAADSEVIFAGRSYFGVLRVREKTHQDSKNEEISRYRYLMHGTTHHGLNYQSPPDLRRLATTYYHQNGPAGRVMELYNWFKDPVVNNRYTSDTRLPASLAALGASPALTNLPLHQLVGLWSEPPYATIGLGTGTMASYGRPFQHVHFYEIDNQVRRFSLPTDGSEPKFNYLMAAQKRGAGLQVYMGDARLRMAFPYKSYDEKKEQRGLSTGGGPDNFYHMMVVDAFSSDAIPIHLITREAIQMYFQKLTPHGILCVHTSNRHVDLVPVVADVANSIQLPDSDTGELKALVCRVGRDNVPFTYPTVWNRDRAHFTSEWVMVARSEKILDNLKAPHGPYLVGEQLREMDYEEARRQELLEQGHPPQDVERMDLSYWKTPRNLTGRFAWTDDYSNVLGVIRWH